MEIIECKISIRDLFVNYVNNDEEGVFAYGGKLNIRPPYQREFVYKDAQRNEVINTINKGFPLNVMYWSDNGKNYFEIIDGQQRTLSICQYLNNDFTINGLFFDNLPVDLQEKILDYQLFIYQCRGTESERLEWFKIINIAGLKLTDQEILNACYTGKWLTDAKKYFSKSNSPAEKVGGNYLNGNAIRQEYLETVLKWISQGKIQEYMGKHQHDENAEELWNFFRDVIDWVEKVFPKYYNEMKGLDWGTWYLEYKNQDLDIPAFNQEIEKLMADEEVQKKSGIFQYVLSREEKFLNLRKFSDSQKRTAYEQQNGICPICEKKFDLKEMHGDHKIPWSKGGKTTLENCQMLCLEDNLKKGAR